jgi:hypothetical protein
MPSAFLVIPVGTYRGHCCFCTCGAHHGCRLVCRRGGHRDRGRCGGRRGRCSYQNLNHVVPRRQQAATTPPSVPVHDATVHHQPGYLFIPSGIASSDAHTTRGAASPTSGDPHPHPPPRWAKLGCAQASTTGRRRPTCLKEARSRTPDRNAPPGCKSPPDPLHLMKTPDYLLELSNSTQAFIYLRSQNN